MDDQQQQQHDASSQSVGAMLRDARVAAGLSADDVAARTKIAVRHLSSIEENRFGDLAGRAYAVGFSRSYARAVGLDEKEIADAVRRQLDAEEAVWAAPRGDTFEPGDPARVPRVRLAWVAALGAVIVIVLLFVFWPTYISPASSLPGFEEEVPRPSAATARPSQQKPAVRAVADPQGQVVFTALEQGVWAKFYDADGKQLFQREMAKGESYAVPADAKGPQIWTARPDALRITVGGRELPRLAETPITIKDQPVTATALTGRQPASSSDPEPR